VLTVDNQRSFYTATAGPDVASPGNPTGRVRAMLAPRHRTGADTAPPLENAPTALVPADGIVPGPSS
jgi:lipopolysaccharide export system protein LptA